jgi:hypothetical protein
MLPTAEEELNAFGRSIISPEAGLKKEKSLISFFYAYV